MNLRGIERHVGRFYAACEFVCMCGHDACVIAC